MKPWLRKYQAMPLPARAALWFTVCNLLLRGIGFITLPLFTRLLPSAEFGTLSLFQSYEHLLLVLCTWEIQLGAYQKGIFKYKDDVRTFTSSTQALSNILTLVFFAVILLIRERFQEFTGLTNILLAVLFVYYLVFPSYTCWLTRKRTSYEYQKAVAATISYTLLTVIFPIAALYWWSRTAEIKLLYTLIPAIAFCFVIYLRHANYQHLVRKWEIVKQHWSFLIRFEAPLVIHSFSYFILNQADRIMIGAMVGTIQAAYYSVAFSLSSIISIFQLSLNQVLLPWRYQMMEKKDYTSIANVTYMVLTGMALLVLAVILITPELVTLLFEADYHEAMWSIPPLAASIYFIFLYSTFVGIETYFEKTRYVMYVSICCAGINILLNLFCIRMFGYLSCGYTTLASYILFTIGHYFFMNKILNAYSFGLVLFKLKSLLFISVLVIVCSLALTLLYPYPSARYTLLTALVLLVAYKQKSIRKTLTSLKAHRTRTTLTT